MKTRVMLVCISSCCGELYSVVNAIKFRKMYLADARSMDTIPQSSNKFDDALLSGGSSSSAGDGTPLSAAQTPPPRGDLLLSAARTFPLAGESP